MRSLFQRRLALLATALAALVLPAAGRAAIQTRHVVIVVIDGARWTETLGDPTLTWHPRMGHDLAAIGAQPGLFQNVGVTNTMPGHAAILTGTLQNILNDGTERPHKPTLFEVLRKQKGTPDSLVRIVAYKAKLAAEAYSDDPAYGAAYGATVHAGFANDSEFQTRFERETRVIPGDRFTPPPPARPSEDGPPRHRSGRSRD